MKIAFFSNYMNHHQLPLSNALSELADSYHFVATKPIPDKKLKFGYEDMNSLPFVVRAYEPNLHGHVAELLQDSDVVIFGDSGADYIPQRMKDNKLSFLFAERFFKKGWYQKFKPTTRKRLARKTTDFNGKNLHLLCAGAYVASDARSIGFKNQCFRWGYLPEVQSLDLESVIGQKQSTAKPVILWVGRFLPWKRPEEAIQLARYLRDANLDFELQMIGAGKREPKLHKLIDKYDLTSEVKLLGSVSPDVVREKMLTASIFLLTSDYHEGWGAVLNEAMNSACCCVCSKAAGSAPTLITHNDNGLLYKFGKRQEMCEQVAGVLRSAVHRQTIGRNAYATMTELWNAPIAAKRFVELADCMLSGREYDQPATGPLSKALEL